MPDPDTATDLADFVRLLGELRAWAGMPSYRVLAKRVGPLMRPARVVGTTTVVDVFGVGRRRLDLDLVVGVVRALGMDEPTVARWRQACIKVHAEAKTGGPARVLGQLPTDLATFTGRREELNRLIEAATAPHDGDSVGANTVVISAIEGMAGVGKTQLAVHAAHELVRAGHFADIQLHVDLRGFDADLAPIDPSAVLAAFLRQLGVPAQQIPGSLDERAAMFRDRLHERSALILLDNAADEDQVRDLIPASPTCLVLITSRRSLAALDSVTPYPLDTFTDSESLDLLIRIAGHDRVTAEPEAAARIVEYCDRLPLALALTAARLRSRPAWTLAELADRLQAGRLEAIRARGRALRPVFELSYRDLAEPLRRVFRLLGHHPGPDFTPAMVAALADIPTHAAETALEQLQDENLVRQNTPGRYELHDLLRSYAAELAQAEPESAVFRESASTAPLGRLATWAVTTGYRAAMAIDTRGLDAIAATVGGDNAQFDTYDDGLAWFDHEQHNLAAVQQAAAEAGLHRPAWHLALIQKQHCVVRYRFAEFLPAARQAYESAHASGDQAAEALMLSGLGSIYWRTDRLDEAADCYLRVRQLYRDLKDRTGEGSALIDYGAVVAQRAEYEQAVDLFTQALDLLDSPDALRTRATALSNRGALRQRQGHLAPAVTDTRQALTIYRQLDDRHNEAQTIGTLAWLHLTDADLDTAIDLYREQQQLALRLADTFLQANALLGTGEAHAAAGRIQQARHAWQNALRLYEQINHPRAAEAQQRLDTTSDRSAGPRTPTDWAAPRHQRSTGEQRESETALEAPIADT